MRFSFFKNLFIGRPLHTERAIHERLPKFLALPVFASDALSSTAYATEEILLVLALAGAMVTSYSIPIALLITLLLVIVTISYRQTIAAYPTGGGAYIVAKENLGFSAARVAGAALLIDYVLTVSVSVAAGIAAVTSAFPSLFPQRVTLGLLAILFITIVNLRGVKESGAVFAIPAYTFVVSFFALIGLGFYRQLHGAVPIAVTAHAIEATQSLSLFLLLRAFASGCTALTGIEAISNGVQAFKPPEAKNARITMAWMSLILGTLFLGITYLAHTYHILPTHDETVISLLTRQIVGRGPFYFLIQAATAMILILAANTSFADFPRLSALMARDGFLPRQMANIGDRLVYSNGMIILGVLSSSLVIIFQGSTHLLIPLYAIGVFLSFTTSQAGMVRHWFSTQEKGWWRSAILNGMGAISTGVVLLVVASAKFMQGAWVVVLLIPFLVWLFGRIHDHYEIVRKSLSLEGHLPEPRPHHTVILLVPGIHAGVIPAIHYARSLGADVRALYLEISPDKTAQMRADWEKWAEGIPLVIVESPYRALVGPLMDYLDEVERERPGCTVTVIVPEFVVPTFWAKLLHNQSGLMLKLALLFRKNIVVTNVRYHLEPA